jgi:hypothetical protein
MTLTVLLDTIKKHGAVGVPVDNTVGTAIISITDMGALLAAYNV